MDSDDELRRAPRAAPPPQTLAVLPRAFLRLAARHARVLLSSTEGAPLEGSLVSFLVFAGLRRAPVFLLGVALARVRAHRAPAEAAAEHPAPRMDRIILRAFLRLPARYAHALLSSTLGAPMEGSLVGFLVFAGLRRARDAAPLYGEGHLALPERAEGDEVAPFLLLRVALARVRAHRVPAEAAADHPAPRMDRIIFSELLHRARRQNPAPRGVFLVRFLLRVPAQVARRLLPPPAQPARSPEPDLATILVYAGLRRLEAALPVGNEGLLMEFVMVLGPLSRRLLPPPREDDHALPPLPPPVEQSERGGFLMRALSWRPHQRADLLPDADSVLVVIGVALDRLRTGPAPANVLRFERPLLNELLQRARGLGPPPPASLLGIFLRLPVSLARRLLPPAPQPAALQGPAAVAEPAHQGPSIVPVLPRRATSRPPRPSEDPFWAQPLAFLQILDVDYSVKQVNASRK